MTYDMARPRYTLALAGKDYDLVGSFELIEAVEYALKDDIVRIVMRAIELPVSDTARLLAAILNACGQKVTPGEMGSLMWDMGIGSQEFTMLRLQIHAFLRICISRPADREEKAKKMGEVLGEWSARTASPGENTSNSA